MTKMCTKCKIEKSKDCFRKIVLSTNELSCRSHCKECEKIYNKKYFDSHKEEDAIKCKQYYQENSESIRNRRKRNYNANKELAREKRREYYQLNKDKEKEYALNRRKNNVQVRVKQNISRRLRDKVLNVSKERKTSDYLGCTLDFFKTYIESKMKPGMTWDNYGRDGWHLDHVIPCSHFDLTKQEDIFKCFNYTNYDPKWAIDNLSKGDRFIG